VRRIRGAVHADAAAEVEAGRALARATDAILTARADIAAHSAVVHVVAHVHAGAAAELLFARAATRGAESVDASFSRAAASTARSAVGEARGRVDA